MALGRDPHGSGSAGCGFRRTSRSSGYDDSRLIAFTDPPLTTVRQAVTAMGTAAVQALLDGINGTPAPRDEFVFRPELVVRGSTGPAPAATLTSPQQVLEVAVRSPSIGSPPSSCSAADSIRRARLA